MQDTVQILGLISDHVVKAIERMKQNGVSIINNPQVFMRWNWTFRINKKFPHPNTNIQNGYTYVPTFLDSDDDALSQDDLLHLFGLNKICLTTVWKWMKYMGFSYDKQTKTYFSDHHEDEANKTCQKKIYQKIF